MKCVDCRYWKDYAGVFKSWGRCSRWDGIQRQLHTPILAALGGPFSCQESFGCECGEKKEGE